MPTKKDNLGNEQNNSKSFSPLSWLGAFMKGLKDYNVFEMLKVLFGGFCLVIMILLVTKPEIIFEQFNKVITTFAKVKEDKHAESTEWRLRADENIRGELTGLLQSTNASRAFVMEFHNGSSNLSSGLPFLYLDLTMDVGADGEAPLREGQYKDLRTAQYPLINILLDQGYWYGTIDEIKSIDQRLWYHLAANDVSEIAVMTLWNGQSATGFLCLTWHGDKKMNAQETGRSIRESGTKIAVELALWNRMTS